VADPLSDIHSVSSAQATQETELRSLFLHLQERIGMARSDGDISIKSSTVVFEEGGDGDAIYGYLFYDHGELSVAYRSREDDEEDARVGESYGPSYSVMPIERCSFKWLRVLSQAVVVESLLEAMLAEVSRLRSETEAGIAVLRNVLNAPIRDAEAAFEHAASVLGYADVIADWHQAQACTYTDPPAAITRASSLIESVLTHILGTMAVPLPDTRNIQNLLKPTLKALALSDEDLPSDDLKQMSRGIVTMVQSLGALRTHASTAHGRGPNLLIPGVSEARFAVNLAGTLATFLMEATRQDEEWKSADHGPKVDR
jgi:hypothetical protein